MSAIGSVALPAAVVRWRLDGPRGPGVDTLVAALVGAGVHIEPIAAGTAYRLDGSAHVLQTLSDKLSEFEGYSLAHEQAPENVMSLSTERTPAYPFVRSVTIHGNGSAATWVARAVDARLHVSTVGMCRWSVTGRTAALIEWLCAVWEKPAEAVCESLGITPDQITGEDAPPATVSVALPTRKTVSEITRNQSGGITQIVQFETTP